MNQKQTSAPDTSRLFLALLPGHVVKAALAIQRDQWHWPAGAACYAPEDWHLTLHFMGAVPRSRVEALRAGLRVPMQPFELTFGRAELWPHGLAVVCPESVPGGLRQLHDRLGQALQHLGLRTDARPYRPHITLARHAQTACAPLPRAAFDWSVTGYALVESTGQATPRYQVLQRYGAA